MAESTTKFVKERTGNAAQIDEIELIVLAEMYNHPIEHVIEEINAYDFPELEDYQSHMWLGNLKQGYDPDQYYKDISSDSKVHEVYMATISYDTGTTFPITINGHMVKALLNTGVERVAWT